MAAPRCTVLSHFVATDSRHLDSMLRAAPISADDVVLDVGSGDCRFLKSLVAATGCRGIGVEICSALHDSALRHCSAEIADGQVTLLNAPVEELEFQKSDVLEKMGRITHVYLYLLPATVETSLPLLKLLDELLASGAFVITNTFVLPPMVVACKVGQWPPERASGEELGELIGRVSRGTSSGNFHVYRRNRLCAHPFHAWEMCGAAVLARLRSEPSIQEILRRFVPHPWVLSVEAGTLSVAQKFNGLFRNYSAFGADVEVFAALAGYEDFSSTSWISAAVVPKPRHGPDVDADTDLWHPILTFSILVAQASLAKARSVERVLGEQMLVAARTCPSLWAGCGESPGAAAAAVAVGLPWMLRVVRPLLVHTIGSAAGGPEVLRRCNLLRLGLDAKACRVMEGSGVWLTYEDIQRPVFRLLEEISTSWDAFFAGA